MSKERKVLAVDTSHVKPVVFGASNIPGFEVGDKALPAVIFVQEWWGVTNIVKQQAAAIAERGYRVLIPDLYKGTVGVDMEEASHLLTSLDYHQAVEEIRAAAQYLKHTGSPAVGIAGGCMGGALAFAAAQHVSELACAVPLYGTPVREMPWIVCEKIRVPVQYHTGMLDSIEGFSDPRTALALTDRMRRAGCITETYVYEETPHSFLNAMTEEGVQFLEKWGYGVGPSEQVWLCFERMLAFFDAHLKGGHREH